METRLPHEAFKRIRRTCVFPYGISSAHDGSDNCDENYIHQPALNFARLSFIWEVFEQFDKRRHWIIHIVSLYFLFI